MFLVMLVGLYTSRVVLSVLGVDDFGIYNVVGGVVATMGFLNSALAAASQRFISYELGKGNLHSLNNVFSTSVTVHTILAIVCCLLFESVGIWFLNAKMNIDPERLTAANWVFQCSILTFAVNVINVPYNASIVAHEKMGAYAYISIFEVILKLCVVFALNIFGFDKLILYALLQLLVAGIIRICYVSYCKRNFEECHFKMVFEKKLFKKMFSFAGWSIVGNIGFTMKEPLSNIILNLFFGTAVNAARGIAMQVNAMVSSLASNFGMAMNPQIVKRYASGDIVKSVSLVYAGARLSFYLIMIMSIPIIINIDYLLQLWLVQIPEYTKAFFVLTLLSSLVYSLSGTSSVAVQATGDIKWFSIGVCIIPILELPIAYILLNCGYPPYFALLPSIVVNFIALLFRFYILKSLVVEYAWSYFLIHVVGRSMLAFVIALLICLTIYKQPSTNFFQTLYSLFLCFAITLAVICTIGINREERRLLLYKIKSFIRNKIQNGL